ncbi:MAG: selenoneine biosynthesis selenosugar synthase SenB [Pseudomonadota bacterium]
MKPRVCIVSPALAAANNGNWHTAARWQRFLAPKAEVQVLLSWQAEPADALIALHARRSADSIERFRAAHPGRPLAVVLTGTDLYRDLELGDAQARHSLQCADQVVVLQPEALHRLPAEVRAKARSIVQSASRVLRRDQARMHTDFVAVGHLRAEKDPHTLMQAARLMKTVPGWRITHIGNPLDEALAAQARSTMAEVPAYRWLGGLPAPAARRWIARGHALVHMSRMEGGANVVIEAVRSRVPVLASRIDGNVGLLGPDYGGYFPVGDAPALAALMQRFMNDPAWADGLRAQCLALEAGFEPRVEAAAVRRLLHDLLAAPAASRDAARLPQSRESSCDTTTASP